MPRKEKPNAAEQVEDEEDPDFELGPEEMKQLLAGGNPALVAAMQQGLMQMVGQSSGYIESLPAPVRTRIDYLEQLQEDYDKAQEQFEEEVKALEAKFKKLYEPIIAKRRAIITGEQEAPENLTEEGKKAVAEDESATRGIPEFWLTALRNHPELDDRITDKDAEVLAYLEDIRTEDLYDEDGEDEGYKLTFTFSDNPFMTDKELSVEYRVVETGGYVSVRDIQGSDIHWKADKDVTVKKMKKKPKPGSKAKPLVKVEPVDSFFRWFSPPEVPEEGEEEADDEDIEAAEEHMALGELLREQIIPNAVEWFTGVAALEGEESLGEDEFDDEEEDDEDDEDDDEDEDEDDDDDDEEEEGDAAGRGPKDSKDPAECKQQ